MAETDCSQIASKDFHITAKTTADLGSATKLSQESFVQPADERQYE
jgi:hypothetical protein